MPPDSRGCHRTSPPRWQSGHPLNFDFFHHYCFSCARAGSHSRGPGTVRAWRNPVTRYGETRLRGMEKSGYAVWRNPVTRYGETRFVDLQSASSRAWPLARDIKKNAQDSTAVDPQLCKKICMESAIWLLFMYSLPLS